MQNLNREVLTLAGLDNTARDIREKIPGQSIAHLEDRQEETAKRVLEIRDKTLKMLKREIGRLRDPDYPRKPSGRFTERAEIQEARELSRRLAERVNRSVA